jgi:hypothetical protein
VDTDTSVHPDFERWLSSQRRAPHARPDEGRERRPGESGPDRPLTIGTGELGEPVHLDPDSAVRLVVTAAKMAAGFFRPTRRSVIVWREGDSELAVEIGSVKIAIGSGRVDIVLPVRCDQTGPADVIVTFAVGREGQPAGLYASTLRRPLGPKLVIDTWGEALVAFAWNTLLTLTSQLAGASGKDTRGNVLIPAELTANADGLIIHPMGRFRFSGAAGLKGTS